MILEIANGKFHVYDSRYSTDEWMPQPKAEDVNFRATVLAFELPNSEFITDTRKPVKVADTKTDPKSVKKS